MKVTVFWLRRDLRLHDNVGLEAALNSSNPVLPIFIFDKAILSELNEDDARLSFIHQQLTSINNQLHKHGSGVLCLYGSVVECWQQLIEDYDIAEVFANKDYEPYAIKRDNSIKELLTQKAIDFQLFKDHLIFEAGEILKSDSKPYTVYTPFKNKWLAKFQTGVFDRESKINPAGFLKKTHEIPSLTTIGFKEATIKVRGYSASAISEYDKTRDIPSLDGTTFLGTHLRFGTLSIRQIIRESIHINQTFINELIWREFFSQILYFYPASVYSNFKSKYDAIEWRNNEEEFEKWTKGMTGYPMVDAGMRQLNETGFMHNRTRMITAGFLCKHLLIDWKWGEAYFAKKLLDYDLASNVGNWQWAAGTGCDAAPYFRVFNPQTQALKFDPENKYINKWIPELNTLDYPSPIVAHSFARKRALDTYKEGLLNG